MRSRLALSMLALSFAAAAPSALAGQRSALREVRGGDRGRGGFGLSFVVGDPMGDFARYGDVAGGLNLFGAFPLGRSGALDLRLDGSWFFYGHDGYGNGLSTTYSIGTLGIGPQLNFGEGPVRAYGFATVGGSLFYTATEYRDYCGCYGSETLYDDGHFTTATQLGAGLLLTVSRRRSPVAIDLGVRDLRNDRVTYVPTGGVTQNSDGSFTVDHVTTPVRLRVYHFGVSFGF